MAITTEIPGGPVQLTGNPVWVNLSGASPPGGAVDYKLLLQVISLDGKLDGAPYPDGIAPDSSGCARFNISGLVDQPLKKQFQYPLSGAVKSYPTQAFNVQVKPGESYIDQEGLLQENWFAESEPFQLLKGGTSPRQITLWEEAGTNFYETYLAAGKFLTARPWGDFVHPRQPVKLWYMVTSDTSAVFNVKSTLGDGSTRTFSQSLTLNTDNLYEFNCNPTFLDSDPLPEGQQIDYFDVWLESGGQTLSDNRRFHLQHKYCKRPYYLLFANSFGGIDDVYLGGYATEGIRIQGNTVYKPLQKEDTVFERSIVTPNRQGQNTWKINTGYKQSTEMLFLRDLMVSRQVWLLYPNLSVTSYVVIPVCVETMEAELVDRQKQIYDLTLELAEAHTSQFTFDNRLY